VLSFPFDTIGTSLTGLLTAVSGNLFELSPFSGLKLRALTLPPAFTNAQPGPGFGVGGTRELTGVWERPLVGTIIKPSVGLTPEETATLVSELCEADWTLSRTTNCKATRRTHLLRAGRGRDARR
jgi:ribulose-bisphosphate carboxylase large chain